MRFNLGKIEAQRFYTKAVNRVRGSNKGGLGWTEEAFDTVDWDTLAKVTRINSEGFQLWLSKQAIGVCATQKNTARIQDILDDRCPNCGQRGEDSRHLNRCPDPGRIKLFRDGVRKLKRWMNKRNQTDSELAFWINQYLLHRGQVRMTNLAMLRPMSKAFQEAAETQDLIGWGEFLHGKVSIKLRRIQEAHCIISGTRINGADWMVQFVRQLVEISHAQWMYRNFTLHHYAKGYLRQRTEREIQREVGLLRNTRSSELPMECRYLLELPERPSLSTSSTHDAYWILALKAARAACFRKEREYAQKSTRARSKQSKTSRNLLDGVRTSLLRRLLTDAPSRKRVHRTEELKIRSRRGPQAQGQQQHTEISRAPKRVRQD